MQKPNGPLSNDKMAATLLLSIDQELAAKVLRNLGDDTLDQVTRAMKELSELAVDVSAIQEVFRAAIQRLRDGGLALGDVQSGMETMLTRAFGDERGADIHRRAQSDILAKKPFAMFEALTAEDLANLLTEEHPQIAAVFMAHLDRKKAGQVLNNLSDDLRADLVYRVSTLDRTPPDVVQRVLEVMRQKVKDLGLTSLRSEPGAWIKAAADILNNMGGGDKAVLETVSKSDDRIAAMIREEMFVFDDIGKLDKKSMQKVLGAIDTRVLAVSLKAASQETEESILGNLSQRAGAMVVEERDSLGPMPLSEVVDNQQQILTIVRDLMDSGEVAAGGSEELV